MSRVAVCVKPTPGRVVMIYELGRVCPAIVTECYVNSAIDAVAFNARAAGVACHTVWNVPHSSVADEGASYWGWPPLVVP